MSSTRRKRPRLAEYLDIAESEKKKKTVAIEQFKKYVWTIVFPKVWKGLRIPDATTLVVSLTSQSSVVAKNLDVTRSLSALSPSSST